MTEPSAASVTSAALSPIDQRELDRYLATIRNAHAGLKRSAADAAEHAMILGRTLAQLRAEPHLWVRRHEDEQIGWGRFCTEVLGYHPRSVLYHVGVGKVVENLTAAFGMIIPLSNFAAQALIGHAPDVQAAAYMEATAGGREATADSLEAALERILDDHEQAKAETEEAGDGDGSNRPSAVVHRQHRPPLEAWEAIVEGLAVKAERPKVVEEVPMGRLVPLRDEPTIMYCVERTATETAITVRIRHG